MQRNRDHQKMTSVRSRALPHTNSNNNVSETANGVRYHKVRRRRDDTSSQESISVQNCPSAEDERRWNEMKRLIRLEELNLSTILGDFLACTP